MVVALTAAIGSTALHEPRLGENPGAMHILKLSCPHIGPTTTLKGSGNTFIPVPERQRGGGASSEVSV